MKTNYSNIQTKGAFGSITTQARLLMSQTRHKQNNRQQSMLQRAAEQVGING
jgi:hypothetical protein